MHSPHSTNRGTALLTALLIVAMIVTLVTLIMGKQRLSIFAQRNLLRATQATQYAYGVEAWAITKLRDPNLQNRLTWPIELAPVSYEEAEVQGTLVDLQSRFNLNTLTQANKVAGFLNFLHHVIPNSKNDTTFSLWIDEIQHYIKPHSINPRHHQLPYRLPGRPMVSISEVALLPAVDLNLFQTITPFVSTLPPKALLNVNTASEKALLTLDGKMTVALAQALIALRQEGPLSRAVVKKFFQDAGLSNTKDFAVKSRYFLLRTTIGLKGYRLHLISLLSLSEDNQEVTILWRKRGKI